MPASQSTAEGTRVLSRLHALFNTAPSSTDAETNEHAHLGGDAMANIKNEPAHLSGDTVDQTAYPVAKSEPEFKDRTAIKVLVVTWNMGDSLVSRVSSLLFASAL